MKGLCSVSGGVSVDGEKDSLCFPAALRLQNTTPTPQLEVIAPKLEHNHMKVFDHES